jgi:hypothetical protein
MTTPQLTLLATAFLRWLAWFIILMGCGGLIIWLYARYRRWLILLLMACLVALAQLTIT